MCSDYRGAAADYGIYDALLCCRHVGEDEMKQDCQGDACERSMHAIAKHLSTIINRVRSEFFHVQLMMFVA